MISLDDLDHSLISALRHNARTPVSALAVTTGASRATVAARIDRLVASGTIAAFTIRTGAELSGSGVRAIVMIEIHGKMADRVATLEETLNRFGASQFAPRAASRRAETDEPELQSSDEPGNPAPEEAAEPVSRSSRSFALQREKRALSL